MSYAFPEELAEQVLARWTTFVARHDRPAPPLPSVQELRYILETAFFASFAREEGRSLRFVMCCAPSTTVPRDSGADNVPVIAFTEPRPLTVDVIRSLAPAVGSSNAAILVQFASAGTASPTIAGVLNVGSSLARVRRGRSIYQRPAPYALLIDVRDAGELHVYRGGIKLATLKSGSLQAHLAYSELEFLPISAIITRGLEVMRPRLRAPTREPAPETSDFEWTSLLNTILSIVNGLEAHGHGGTLLVAGPGADRTLPIRVKFDVDSENRMLPDRFTTFVNARHALVEAKLARKAGDPAAISDADLAHLDDATAIAEEDLSNATEIIARLSAVDGALAIGSDLRVLGFGTEIVLDASRPFTAYQGAGHSQRAENWPAVDSESFGMRHRSALRCVAVAEDTAAFVASQDGTVSFFWKQNGRVIIKRGVTISNPNMGGG